MSRRNGSCHNSSRWQSWPLKVLAVALRGLVTIKSLPLWFICASASLSPVNELMRLSLCVPKCFRRDGACYTHTHTHCLWQLLASWFVGAWPSIQAKCSQVAPVKSLLMLTQRQRGGQDDYIKATLLSDPRVQLSGFLTGRTSSRFYGLCPKAILFCSPPSLSISPIRPLVSLSPVLLFQVTRPPLALMRITSFWLLSLSFFLQGRKWRHCGFLFPGATN